VYWMTALSLYSSSRCLCRRSLLSTQLTCSMHDCCMGSFGQSSCYACYTHLCTMTWWLNELQLQSKLRLDGCASPHRGCPSSDQEREQMTVAHTQTGRGKSKLFHSFNVTSGGHSWFSDLNSIGVSEQCFLAPSMVWKPARSATGHATRLTTDSSASHLRVFFSHWIIHPTVRLRSTRNLRCRSRGAFPAGFRLTVTERENISLIRRAQNS